MKPDLIHGYKAIAAHLGISPAIAKSEAEQGWLPTFRMGTGTAIYARPSELDRYAVDRKARQEAQKGAGGASPQRGALPITDPVVIAARIADRASQIEVYRERRKASAQAQREADQAQREANGILHGMNAIAEYLGLEDRVAKHLHNKGSLPTFRLGRRVCARRAELDSALSANAPDVPKGSGRYGPRDPAKRSAPPSPGAGAPPPAPPPAPTGILSGYRAIAAHLRRPLADVTRLDAERRLPTYQDDGCTVASTAALDHWACLKGGAA